MLTDIELGYRLKQRAGSLMLKAFTTYAESKDLLERMTARYQYEVYRADYCAIQTWLEVKMLCALLQEYGQSSLALGYDEVSRQWRIMGD